MTSTDGPVIYMSSYVLFDDASESMADTFSLEPGWVEVEDGVITAVGRGTLDGWSAADGASDRALDGVSGRASDRAANERASNDCGARAKLHASRVVDLGQRLLTPAFVDSHTHLALVALRGLSERAAEGNLVEDIFYQVESRMTGDDVRAFARFGAYESMLSGVGLVWDHYFFGVDLAKGIADAGLSAVIAPTLQDLDGPHKDQSDAALLATETLTGREFSERGIYAAAGPHATDTVSAACFEQAVSLAKKHGIPLHAHLAQSVEEVQRVFEREGKSPVQFLESTGALEVPGVFAHGLYVPEVDLKVLAQSEKSTLVVAPFAQLLFAFLARTDLWEKAQVPWTIATDAAAANDGKDLRSELRLMYGAHALHASFSPEAQTFLRDGSTKHAESWWSVRNQKRDESPTFSELLDRVFSAPGRLHPKFVAGTLAPGALANLCVWDLKHPSFWPVLESKQSTLKGRMLRALTLGETTATIDGLIVRGQELPGFLSGNFARSLTQSQSYQDAQKEATARLAELLF